MLCVLWKKLQKTRFLETFYGCDKNRMVAINFYVIYKNKNVNKKVLMANMYI